MSVIPMNVNPDGGIYVWHDDKEHGGTVPVNQLSFAPGPSGVGTDWRFIQVPCPYPGCGAVSTHPISGGADAPRVQYMFAKVLKRIGTIPPNIVAKLGLASGDVTTWEQALDIVELLTTRMDGKDRFHLKDKLEDDELTISS